MSFRLTALQLTFSHLYFQRVFSFVITLLTNGTIYHSNTRILKHVLINNNILLPQSSCFICIKKFKNVYHKLLNILIFTCIVPANIICMYLFTGFKTIVHCRPRRQLQSGVGWGLNVLFSKESGSRYFIYIPRKTLYDGEAEFVDGIQVRVVGLQ